MFMGEYNHTIDAKGRLIVPSKFREQLGNEFVVTKGLDGCLFVYSNEEWHRIEESLREKPLTSKDARKFMRFFFAEAADIRSDRPAFFTMSRNTNSAIGERQMLPWQMNKTFIIYLKLLENADFP